MMEHKLCRSVQSAHVVLHDQGVLANAILGALVRASDEAQLAEQVRPTSPAGQYIHVYVLDQASTRGRLRGALCISECERRTLEMSRSFAHPGCTLKDLQIYEKEALVP